MKKKQTEEPSREPVYQIRGASKIRGVPVQIVSQELQTLAAANDNDLTPAAVLEAARPADATLHPLFDWDNRKAGERWRLYQARTLIMRLTINDTRQFYPVREAVVVDQKRVQRNYYKEPEHFSEDEAQSAFDTLYRQLQGVQRSIDQLKNILAGQHDHDKLAMFEQWAAAFAQAQDALKRIH